MAVAAGWLAAAGMSVAAGARLWRSQSEPVLIGLQGTVIWSLLPAYPLAVAALVGRRRALAAVAGALCVAHAGWTLAAVGWHGDRPAPAGTVQVRLVTANVLLDNPSVPALADDLLAARPDVLLLQEVTPQILDRLAGTPLWQALPYRVTDPLPGFHGSAILSRWPVLSGGAFDVAGFPMTQADIRTPAGPVHVVDVHAQAPLSHEAAARWSAQFDRLARLPLPAGRPLVLAGDFNATLDHRPMQRLLAAGFRDAFAESGTGLGATWPEWSGPVPPLMRLDHVLVNDPVTVLSIRERTSPGSDHRRLEVELAVPVAR
ncbi:endonuclease/exonuclease/phosphatase family protein [Nakamurella endophytica]|uniref:endonuclease/exonuclease/phosphatase family protein n=1 Tax=Nakamurella endophytica TaxID=1748367 RepID=UPI001666CB45|nr:endonuclease/exonuclease/phosphatase family protein [Nakamurella endophytica]